MFSFLHKNFYFCVLSILYCYVLPASFFSMTTLYPSSRPSTCISFFFFPCIYYYNKFKKKKKKKKKQDPCKSWVKISKVMPQSHVRSPGKGREALRQKSKILRFKIYGLTVHIIHIFKFMA